MRPAAREVVAVVVAGLLSAGTWLWLMQQSFTHDYTGMNTDLGLGRMFGGAAGGDALRKGLQVTLLSGVVTAVLFALARRPLRLGWLARGLLFGVLAYLVWGLVFCTHVDAHDVPGGVFGSDAGHGTPVVGAVAALVAGVVLARVHELARTAAWWEPKHMDLRESIREIFQQGRADGPADGTNGG
ncbi:MAG: hypothetical protein U0Y82_15335 [Thermoleophilia bacterium]